MNSDDLTLRLHNLWAMLEEEGYYTKANTVELAINRIEELEAKLAEVTEDRDDLQIALASARKHLERYVAEAEAALPAVYRLALEDAVNILRTKRTHVYTTRYDEFVQTHTRGVLEMADMIEASPSHTADELMARIQTGEK